MKRVLSMMVAVLAISIAASASSIPAGWSCTGTCGTLGADGVVTLGPSGNPYEYITTMGGPTGAGQLSGYGGTNGSMLQTSTFSANGGDPG